MCRVFLYIARDSTPKKIEKILSQFLNQSSQKQKFTPGLNHPRDNPPHRTGYGFAFIREEEIQRAVYDWQLYKTKKSPDTDLYRDTIIHSISSQTPTIILGHLRKIDNNRIINYSPKSYENAHPFLSDEHAYIHNGIILDFHLSHIHEKILNKIGKQWREQIQGQTDSEHIFYLFLTFLQAERERAVHVFKRTPYEHAFQKMIDWFIENGLNAILNIIYVNSRDLIYLFSRYSIGMNGEEPTSLYMDPENMIISSEPILKRRHYHLINPNTFYVGEF